MFVPIILLETESRVSNEQSRIIVIDDSIAESTAIEELLSFDGASVVVESDPHLGLALVLESPPDLLIVDVAYAGLDGWEILYRIRNTPLIADLPVVMVTGMSDVDLRIRSFELGADAVVTKPYNRIEMSAMIRNVMRLNRFRKLAEQRLEIQQALILTQQAYDKTIRGWVKALDLRDHETEGHSVRVAQMTVHLAKAFETPQEELPHIWRGALLHDIGKLAVSDTILKKAGPLTAEERSIMEMHPVHAKEMLEPIEYLQRALPIPVYHHEKFDGTGYPYGLKGEDIPFVARLFAVVDVWDALSFDRPYRNGLPQSVVRKHLVAERGTHFDPRAADMFLQLLEYFDSHVPSVSAMWKSYSRAA